MSKPRFKIGCELECLVHPDHLEEFLDAMVKLGVPRLDLEGDGSLSGTFEGQPSFEDGDLNQCPIGEDVEIRTPPLPIKRGLAMLDRVLKVMQSWSKQKLLMTNDTCGFHFNISEHWATREHDRFCQFYARMVELFPEYDVLSTFNRQSNNYCRPLFPNRNKPTIEVISSRVKTGVLGHSKYHSLGLDSHPGDDPDEIDFGLTDSRSERRIEFRCIGNKNYHLANSDLKKAVRTILACANEAFIATRADYGKSGSPVDVPTGSTFTIGQPSMPQAVAAG